jgi:hypothetical protein
LYKFPKYCTTHKSLAFGLKFIFNFETFTLVYFMSNFSLMEQLAYYKYIEGLFSNGWPVFNKKINGGFFRVILDVSAIYSKHYGKFQNY